MLNRVRKLNIQICLFCLIKFLPSFGQEVIQTQIDQVTKTISGNVGVYAYVIEGSDTISLNGEKAFPMQSVYKFPIAMAILDQVDKGNLSLNTKINIEKSEYIPKNGYSPIRDKFPNGVTLTIGEILKRNIESDGTACDVLLRLLGGPKKAELYIHSIGVRNIAISTTEMVQIANDTIQYQNWVTPKAMCQLLSIFYNTQVLSKKSKALLTQLMLVSNPYFDKRIKALLPMGTIVAHKTGTAGTFNGLTRATNDVGIITLPNGNHLVLSVFISDSYAVPQDREMVISKISKILFEKYRQL